MPSARFDESSSLSTSSRRSRLLLGGASLLALGVVLNVGRVWSVEPEALEMQREEPDPMRAAGSAHHGEEGKMGRPSSKAKHGLYAMKGSSPASGPDEDVWGGLTGSEIGEAYGVGGLGMVGTGRGGGGTGEGTIGLGNTGLIGKGGGSGYGKGHRGGVVDLEPRGGTHALPPGPQRAAQFVSVARDPMSTFSIDVDTASYSAVRSTLQRGELPEPDAVRIEELLNYFDYDYARPTADLPFSVTAEVGECPWNPDHELVHIGLQGKTIPVESLPPRNLVFLVDVSGSMSEANKLPLVRYSLSRLAKTLRAEDRISLVVYAGAAGVVLPPTAGSETRAIHDALARLEAGGGTNGAAGIEQAYAQARAAFMQEGVNRVIMASDGDFNVGTSSHDELVKLIERERESGIELSVLGYGMGHRDHTMEQLADKGNGNYAYIDSREEAHKVLVEQAGGTLVTIAKDVKIHVELTPARVKSYRLLGYENRRLAHRDFADDTKDAGEIGAGHSVTALYEVVPQPGSEASEAPWMTVELRYKQPKGDTSTLVSLPVVAEPRELAQTTDDFRFSAAVAEYGMLLRGSALKGNATWGSTQALAREALGSDPTCRRHHFLELVAQAGTLAGDDQASAPLPACEPAGSQTELTVLEPLPPTPPDPAIDDPRYEESPPQPQAASASAASPWPWVLEVLRLLPPLLALPLFFMALRRPRRRED